MGKMAMIQCVRQARRDALITKNIKAGWKATGLWPVNMAKPLMSPLLMENSNQTPKKGPRSQPQPSPYTHYTPGPRPAVGSAVVGEISTPRKKSDLRKLFDPETFCNLPRSTQRLAIWKLPHACDTAKNPWFAGLDVVHRVYLGHWVSPSAGCHFQGQERSTAMVLYRQGGFERLVVHCDRERLDQSSRGVGVAGKDLPTSHQARGPVTTTIVGP